MSDPELTGTRDGDRRSIQVGSVVVDSGTVIIDPSLVTSRMHREGIDRETIELVRTLLLDVTTLARRGDVRPPNAPEALPAVAFLLESDGEYLVGAEYDDRRGRVSRVVIDLPDEPEL